MNPLALFNRARGALPRIAYALLLLTGSAAQAAPLELVVTTTEDSGAGSLRAALEAARAEPEHHVRITFGDREGLFSTPQTMGFRHPFRRSKGTSR